MPVNGSFLRGDVQKDMLEAIRQVLPDGETEEECYLVLEAIQGNTAYWRELQLIAKRAIDSLILDGKLDFTYNTNGDIERG